MNIGSIGELQDQCDQAGATIAELIVAVAEAERDAAEAKAEAAELTDGDSVLRAMAEERAAMNRAALCRRNLAETRQRRADLARQLNRAQQAATTQLVRQAMTEAGAALVDVYKEIVAARDAVYQTQTAIGVYPVDSPFDRVCSALESAIGAAGGQVIADTSRSTLVRLGAYEYYRRPVGYVAPVAKPKDARRPLVTHAQQMMAQLNQFNRQRAHEFSDED